MNEYDSNIVKFSGTGLVVYKTGAVQEVVSSYEEITRFIDAKDSLTKDAFKHRLPLWFSSRFDQSGYIFQAENIHRETGLSFNSAVVGEVFMKVVLMLNSSDVKFLGGVLYHCNSSSAVCLAGKCKNPR